MPLNKLTNAIARYNACNFPLFIDSEPFNKLISLRNKCFRKKLLLVNLHEAPKNAHMERAFIRAAAAAGVSGKSVALDIFHSFRNDYSFIGPGRPETGFRIRYSGMANLKDYAAKTKYDAMIFIDLPYGDEELAPYAWLALRDKTPEKFFIANDVLIPRGSIFGMDLAEDLRLLNGFSAVYILDRSGADGWARFGRPRGGVFERDFAVDCVYFDGKGTSQGDYAYSCGLVDRDFDSLFKAAEAAPRGLKFKIYTDRELRPPAKLRSRVELVPYSHDSSKMRSLIAGAKFIVLPISRDAGIPDAGLTVSLMAMAMGKIVLTHGPCIHQYLKDGINAVFYTGYGAARLAAGIKRILALSPEIKHRIAVNARQTVLKRHDLDAFVGGFIDKHCGY